MQPEQLDALVDAARAGNGWAFERLWLEPSPSVVGYLRGRGVPDPDDVTSEVFLAAFQRLAEFDGDGPRFRSWLFTIAHHKGVDAVRRAARAPLVTGYEPSDDPRRTASAETTVVAADESDQVKALLAELSPDQADVMLLRVLGGLTVAEVASVTGRTEGAVKQLQRRAVARLQQRVLRSHASPHSPVPLEPAPTIAPSR